MLAVLVLLVLLAPVAGWLLVRASLPKLDGSLELAGLAEPVTVERDADGVPTVRARNPEDLARTLGFLHAQDRFFQMDLLRRQGAGELSELFGPLTLTMDREARQHLFRRRAAAVVQGAAPGQLRQVDAYVAGVNAGLAALGARPWEYLALRATPRPWTREDCVLVMDAMAANLETDGSDERSRLAIARTYDDEVLAFLRPLVTERSAALDGSNAPAPPIPDASHWTPRPAAPGEGPPVPVLSASAVPAAPGLLPGSNAFALSGARSAGGGALVANDPHLGLAVPNIWYHASLVLPGLTATGTTLPGVPEVVIGSNGHVAWGFTNSYVDTCDLVAVEVDPANPGRYRVPDGDGWEPFEIVREAIGVHGGAPQPCEVLMTRWGPLVTRPGQGGPVYARHWSEYEPGGINFGLADLMTARSMDEALVIAHRSGIHPQNILVGDRDGNVAWTISGPVPHRVGFDGLTPQSWADGARRWDGFLPPEMVPVVRNPAAGQLWTANNRVVGGGALALLGV
ncbi:MAG: penicillin acylase family protein, partial [Gluconacetobacter diazotrophicus]|nr:penicillin acylase family protein [Gluconacetobacter diazotrophicus]